MHGNWVPVLLPEDMKEKQRNMHKYHDTSHRVNVELVRISSTKSHGGSVCWDLFQGPARPRALSVLAADTYVLPGVHIH